MGVAAQVVNGIAEAVESLFNVRTPVLMVEGVAESAPGIRVTEILTSL